MLAPVAGVLLSASPYVVGTDGVHLRRDDRRTESGGLVGRSCHGADELRRARDEGTDYATLSPVAPSPSKPGYGPALGANGLRNVLDGVPDGPPVYALGGVTPANAPRWLAAGSYGIALMGPVMRADDPAGLVRELTGH